MVVGTVRLQRAALLPLPGRRTLTPRSRDGMAEFLRVLAVCRKTAVGVRRTTLLGIQIMIGSGCQIRLSKDGAYLAVTVRPSSVKLSDFYDICRTIVKYLLGRMWQSFGKRINQAGMCLGIDAPPKSSWPLARCP